MDPEPKSPDAPVLAACVQRCPVWGERHRSYTAGMALEHRHHLSLRRGYKPLFGQIPWLHFEGPAKSI